MSRATSTIRLTALSAFAAMVMIAILVSVTSAGTSAGRVATIVPQGAPSADVSTDAVGGNDSAMPQPDADSCQADEGGVVADASRATPRFRGYCQCSCSVVKDCNTSADCGGGACRPTISCC